MRRELNRMQNNKVRVTSVSPGLVSTNIFKSAEVKKDLEEKIFQKSLVPDDIAETICYLLSLPYSVNIHELMIRATGSDFWNVKPQSKYFWYSSFFEHEKLCNKGEWKFLFKNWFCFSYFF